MRDCGSLFPKPTTYQANYYCIHEAAVVLQRKNIKFSPIPIWNARKCKYLFSVNVKNETRALK